MHSKGLQWGLAIAGAIAMTLGGTPTASAQSELAVRYFAQPGYGGEGMPYRDCSLGEDAAFDDNVSDTPVRLDSVDEQSGLTREEREAFRRQVYDLKQQLIVELQQLLDNMPADYSRRADVMFRMAEARKEMADADHLVAFGDFTTCIDSWYQCVSDTECYEPMPDYATAIENYRAVARNHPSYERIDEVIFRLGETLMENDAASEGIQFLTRLVNTYPDSRFIADARILMADHYFDNDLLIAARQNYEEALRFPENNTYNYAIYKIGWVDLNEYAFEAALENFQTVVENLDAMDSPSLDFRNQALNDMLKCYVEIDNGWVDARTYYEDERNDEELMRRQLERLANLYDDKGKDENRVEVYEYFINRYALDSKVPQWAESTLASLTNIGVWDRYEARARQFIEMLDTDTSQLNNAWARENQNDTRAMTNARGMTEGWMLGILTRNFQEAERIRNSQLATSRDLYLETRADYEYFFDRFPDSSEMYDQRFFYAELLYYKLAHDADDTLPGCGADHFLGQAACDQTLFDAGQAYRVVVDLDPDPEAEHALSSAIGYLQVADDFMIREFTDIDAPLPAPGDFASLYDRAPADGEIDEAIPLTQAEQDYVDAVTFFSDMFPDHEDIPAASWRAAKIYLYKVHLGEAAARFETIISHHPMHRLAQDAALASFVCYNAVEDWPKIEYVARTLLEVCDDSEDDICNVEGLRGAIAYSMNNQAEDLMTAGRTMEIDGDRRGSLALYVEAAEKRVSLYREFPDSEWSPLALYGAAATYERARVVDTSVELYNEFIVRYEDNELVPDAMYILGLIHDSQAEFAQAANWFERVNTEYPEWGTMPHSTGEMPAGTVVDAVYNAARLREAMSQFDEAIALYDRYVELQSSDAEDTTQRDVLLQVARIEEDRGNMSAALARYDQVINTYSSDQVRRIAAMHRQAKIHEAQGDMSAAASTYDRLLNAFGRGVATFDEADVFAGWEVEPGGNMADLTARNSVRPFAAEAMFFEADQKFQAASNLDLTFRPGRYNELSDKMVARGEAVIEAQRAMYEVISAGDAQWAVAGWSRMGLLFYEFYTAIFEIPAPDYDECLDATNFNYDACDEAFDQYDEFLFNIGEPLRAKAEATWGEGRRIALDNSIFNDWTLRLMQNLNELDPSYQVGVSEGFAVESTGDPYLSTNYILDLQAKLDAFADFVVVPPDAAGMMLEDGSMAPAGADTMTGVDGAEPSATEGAE